MVRGVPGDTDARGICDPHGRQSSQEPAQSTVGDERLGRGYWCDGATVHAAGKVAALYSAARIVVGRDCNSCGDLSFSRAGRKVLVLPPARAALIRSWCSSGLEMTPAGALEGVVTYLIGMTLGRIGGSAIQIPEWEAALLASFNHLGCKRFPQNPKHPVETERLHR